MAVTERYQPYAGSWANRKVPCPIPSINYRIHISLKSCMIFDCIFRSEGSNEGDKIELRECGLKWNGHDARYFRKRGQMKIGYIGGHTSAKINLCRRRCRRILATVIAAIITKDPTMKPCAQPSRMRPSGSLSGRRLSGLEESMTVSHGWGIMDRVPRVHKTTATTTRKQKVLLLFFSHSLKRTFRFVKTFVRSLQVRQLYKIEKPLRRSNDNRKNNISR